MALAPDLRYDCGGPRGPSFFRLAPWIKPLLALACCTSALAFLPGTAAAQSAPKQPVLEKTHSIEGVTEHRLPNGLRVLTIPDPGADSITVHITYLVGSRHEGYGEKGMAHLL